MGKVQTSCRGSTKAFLGGGRSSRSVGKTLLGKKRIRPAKVIKEHKRNSGVRTDSRGTVESAPRAGLQTSAKAVSPLRFGHRAHKVGYGKVGNGKTAPKKVSITHSREQCELLIERGIKICQRTFVRITHSSLKFYDYSRGYCASYS